MGDVAGSRCKTRAGHYLIFFYQLLVTIEKINWSIGIRLKTLKQLNQGLLNGLRPPHLLVTRLVPLGVCSSGRDIQCDI